MHRVTTGRRQRLGVWLVWLLVVVILLLQPRLVAADGVDPLAGGAGVVLTETPGRDLFPWWPRVRWRQRALAAYRRWQHRRRQAWRAAQVARLALARALTLATLVDWLTRSQVRRQLGAVPVLYALLEELQVRPIINRYCPSVREVDHGTVAVVLIINRLMAPRPLYRIADWLAQTVLVYYLGVPASKFNDDRLARTLDALAPHARDIWLAVVSQAIQRYDIDPSATLRAGSAPAVL